MESIKSFCELSQQPSFLTNLCGDVLFFNTIIGPIVHLSNVFCEKEAFIKSQMRKALAQKRQIYVENNVYCENDFGPCLISPILTEGEPIFLFQLKPVDTFIHLEQLILNRLSKFPSDSRWIINEDLMTIWFQVDQRSCFYGESPGFSLFDAIDEREYSKVYEVLRQAKAEPRTIKSITVGGYRRYGPALVEANIEYIYEEGYGPRFLIASRPIKPKVEDIFTRMMEVFNVGTYKELADILGVAHKTLYNALRKKDIPLRWLRDCQEATGARYWWLTRGWGERFISEKREK